MSNTTLTGLEIAIVGMAGRFPGAPSVDALWRSLAEGKEGISFFSDDELEAAGISPALRADPAYVPARGALAGTDLFDAAFFGFSPREAEVMDPQHRLFLETAWEALENAGYDPGAYPGSIGVYAGSSLRAHTIRVLSDRDLLASVGSFQAHLSNVQDFLATRTAYKLGLRGPAISVQTACSTSLVAVHMASRALLGGECSMALAGGVSVSMEERGGHRWEEGGILSPDGHCRAFDAKSGGTVNGSGVALVVLKRLDDAIADGDTIHAVIKGTALTNDGAAKVGFTAPSVEGQARAITDALQFAEVDASTVGYVEAHGTGTALGDPIEVTALVQAYRGFTDAEGFCALGAVKTNVGHLDAASGVTGLVKTAMALRHGLVPPTLHFTEPNPALPLEGSPFFVASELQPWPLRGVRRAGVSSFGAGGTNAHAVLEQAPEQEPAGPSREWQLVTLSARTPAALERARMALAAHLRARPEQALADVAHTLRVGRAPFRHRLSLVCRTAAEAACALRKDRVQTGDVAPGHAPVAFVFSGEGSIRGAAELYASESVFRDEIDRCAALGIDVRPLFSVDGDATDAARFVIHYALAKLWMSWGITPDAMLGHGAGELAAACLAGVFSLDDAVRIAAGRAGEDAIRSMAPAAPSIPFASAATGGWMTEADVAGAAHWARRIRQPARWSEGVRALLAEPRRVLLEVGAPSAAVRAAAGDRPLVSSLSYESYTRGMVEAAGALWLAGARPDWTAFVAGETRRRVPLPTYPFERRAFRLPARKAAQVVVEVADAPHRRATDRLARPIWTAAAAPGMKAMEPATWLVLEDEGGVGAQLAHRLLPAGHTVLRVRSNGSFAHTGDEAWTARPANADDFESLLDAIGETKIGHFVHCWSADAPTGDDADAVFIAEQARGADTLRVLADALSRRGITPRITVATAGVCDVSGEEALVPARATILSAIEQTGAHHVDFGTDAGARAAARKGEQLLAEIASGAAEDGVAFRGRARFVREWDGLEPAAEPAALRRDGVYLITGGLTEAGLALANEIALPGTRLALLGGLPVPPREMWQMVINACAHAAGPIDLVKAVEAKGAEVAFSAADPTDLGALRIFAATVKARWGRIDGVIHCAALAATGDGRHHGEGEAPAIDHVRSAMEGTQALRAVFGREALDFCLILSGYGAGDEGRQGAQTYLDAFAAAQDRASSFPWISASIAPIRAAEEGEGMAPAAVIDAVRAVLAAPAAQVAVREPVAIEAEAAIEETVSVDEETPVIACPITGIVPVTVEVAETYAGADGRGLSTPYAAPRNEIEEGIAAVWHELLGAEKVGIHDDFFELGGHSLLGIRVLSRLRSEWQVELPAETLFQAPTVAALAQVIETAFLAELDGLSDEELLAMADG